jgi:hypothetical protein
MGLQLWGSPTSGPNIAFELGIGKTWGQWGILGTLVTPVITGLFGPTFALVEGYPTVTIRAQGAAALQGVQGVLQLQPGVEGGLRVATARVGARGYIDFSYAHYFAGGSPIENQVILTTGIAVGGP